MSGHESSFIDNECDCSSSYESSFIDDDESDHSYESILKDNKSDRSYESSLIDDESDDSYESSFIDDNIESQSSDDADEAVETVRHAKEAYKLPKDIVRKMLESDTVCYSFFKQKC